MTQEPLPVQLSVLDLAPVVSGLTARDALRNSVDLARHVDEWGFTRHWVAEHHGMPGVASAAPAVLIAELAAATERIRVGSGGVMLPNHAPLVVAEHFGTLEALHPGRIDLGIGRAPGTDQRTASALRRGLGAEDFPRDLGQLLAFFGGTFPADHPYAAIDATPARGFAPAVWLLGSSGYSAQLAGMLGLPFAFAHHFSAANTLPALELYRTRFTPDGGALAAPYVLIGVNVVCAESDEEARRLAEPTLLSMLRLRLGRPTALPTVAEAAAHRWTPEELSVVEAMRTSQVVGSPKTVRARLAELVDETGVDELIVTTMTPDHGARLASYEALSELIPARSQAQPLAA